ncbi:MAG: hypothetical protein R3266_13570, partial [Gemmatimonadota bacterium]|nr:hypothetical protein [Gemmatimonadota bacterium]
MTPLFDALGGSPGAVWLPWLVDVSLKAAVLLALAFAVTGLARRTSASVRHHVWTLAFAAVLALPLLSAALPSWQVPVPGWRAGLEVGGAPLARRVPDRTGTSGGAAVREESGARAGGHAVRTGAERTSMSGAPSSPEGGETAGPDWTRIVLAIWMAGVVLLLLRLAA